jgi:hypothetical protein
LQLPTGLGIKARPPLTASSSSSSSKEKDKDNAPIIFHSTNIESFIDEYGYYVKLLSVGLFFLSFLPFVLLIVLSLSSFQ